VERTHRILLSTALRSGRRVGGHGEEVSGSLLRGELDVEERRFRVEKQIDLPESLHLAGRRSVRGIALFAGGVAACTTSEVVLLDEDLSQVRAVLSEPRFGDLHSLAVRDGRLYVAATASDSVLAYDESLTRVWDWWAGHEPELDAWMRDWQRDRFRAGHDFRRDRNPGSRFHLNHVFFDEDGDLLVNLPGMEVGGADARIWNVTRHCFELGGRPVPGTERGGIHDGIVAGGAHYLCRTGTGHFLKLDRRTGDELASVDCSVPLGTTTGSPTAVEHGWLRGALHLGDELFLVGQSKLTLFLVDMKKEERSPALRVEGAEGDLDHPGLGVYNIISIPASTPTPAHCSRSTPEADRRSPDHPPPSLETPRGTGARRGPRPRSEAR
jgi:hypothetical protein